MKSRASLQLRGEVSEKGKRKEKCGKGEAERIAQWKNLPNRMLLWHGSKVENFLGILSQGLRIAPPESDTSGWAFGQGIYFADQFQKSFNYTSSQVIGRCHAVFLLLCEVALGKMYEVFQYRSNLKVLPGTLDNLYLDIFSLFLLHLKEHISKKAIGGCKSVKGVSEEGPDPKQSVYLPNGTIVPVGEIVKLKLPKGEKKPVYFNISSAEYIVYDESQVRMRYLVQVSH